mgnify:CR=1 FL=1
MTKELDVYRDWLDIAETARPLDNYQILRLKRFEDFRYVGVRDTMRVYDCDDPEQFARLERRVEADDLLRRNLLMGFAPDTIPQPANRGFRPATTGRR